ncbi:MAG TPA: hypothetical protein DCS89_07175 [Gammaproteobacteria bacterium]|jgi:N-methylhydantoinase A/oxoprolinase/acetone carboxylase beta subunit|nr:hypothetical protein [Gammaproteobacteria bacterium]|tara:strand:- start:1841 stop:2152 length:312 start_codon:yes stop_codon:yes gene_type:complete
MTFKLGVDVGGTFTDALLVNQASKETYTAKVPSTPEDSSIGVINSIVRVCDKQGAIAYLESSNVKNNPLYERHGFEVIGEATSPDGGPTIWFMKRAAREGLSQ